MSTAEPEDLEPELSAPPAPPSRAKPVSPDETQIDGQVYILQSKAEDLCAQKQW